MIGLVILFKSTLVKIKMVNEFDEYPESLFERMDERFNELFQNMDEHCKILEASMNSKFRLILQILSKQKGVSPAAERNMTSVESADIKEAKNFKLSFCFNKADTPVEVINVQDEPVGLGEVNEPKILVQATDVIVVDMMDDIESASDASGISDSCRLIILSDVAVPSILSCDGSSIFSFNFSIVSGNANVDIFGLSNNLLGIVHGMIALFVGWPEFLFSKGFAPGPPKKPPPWFVYIKILVVFGTSIFWSY